MVGWGGGVVKAQSLNESALVNGQRQIACQRMEIGSIVELLGRGGGGDSSKQTEQK